MKVIWLGQAGLLFEVDGYRIMIDPYFSNSVEKLGGERRRVPVEPAFRELKPEAVICTHSHVDHMDQETLQPLLMNTSGLQVLAPSEAWKTLRTYGPGHNYILFNRWTEVTLGEGILVKAVKAEHSDPSAIGVILEAEGKTCYITGDTLYNEAIFGDLPEQIDVVFLPINGAGNNMNMADAARFASRCKAKKVVPVHFGMLDDLDPERFQCEDRIIPRIFREIPL